MVEVIHAHNLMDMIHSLGGENGIGLDALGQAVATHFGEDIRFTNCTGNHYTLDEIIQFLESRQKIVNGPAGYVLNQQNICADD